MRASTLLLLAAGILALPMTTAAQTTPVPRPFPGAPAAPTAPPSTAPAPPATTRPATEPAAPPSAAAEPTPTPPPPVGPDLPGVPPVYPTADYLESIDAGSGQTYYLYGTDASFAEIVAYYRTVLRNGGREIYRTPGLHQFELGRYDDDRMVYPPSVVVKDYAGEASGGYLFVNGTDSRRYRTIIQVVPPDPRDR